MSNNKSKSKNTSGSSNKSNGIVIGFLSFVGILCWAVVTILGYVGISLGTISWLGHLFLLLAAFVSAWLFVAHKTKGWKITYAVIVVIAILVFVCGYTGLIPNPFH